ncbi:MAG: hypothetical protein JWM15_2275, partial [Cryptosporangiaceae bacterium]|nr:hypothetical protein [Cryptosporangiaceae bacterium]
MGGNRQLGGGPLPGGAEAVAERGIPEEPA